jgi:hypothetical protein
MLAMNMSKVLSAFGLMKKFESSNETSKLSNEQMLMALDAKAAEAKGEFAFAYYSSQREYKQLIYDYIGTLKQVFNWLRS